MITKIMMETTILVATLVVYNNYTFQTVLTFCHLVLFMTSGRTTLPKLALRVSYCSQFTIADPLKSQNSI